MREKILLNRGWRLLVNPGPDPVAKTKAGMYLSAKTERLKWGPGTYHHIDTPEYWSSISELPEERWQAVDLPHDYIISQAPDENETGALGFFHYVPAWYRRHFTLGPEDEGRRLAIYFEGITGISDIYLNGCFLKHNNGGYCSFEVDITDLARFDAENVLAVHIDPNSYETWWYAGGGIYRNVWLCKTDTVAVDLWGVFVAPRHLGDDRWDVPVEVTLRNIGYADEAVAVRCELLDPAGQPVATLTADGGVPARGKATLRAATTLDAPQRWDIDTPRRYTAVVTVTRGGADAPCDEYRQKFGFRTIEWSGSQGLFLNGRNLKIKGVCGHLDCGLTGKAVPDNLCRYKMQLVKEMGANAIRTSHYPHQEAVMEACDELGLLVMDETRRFESCEDGLAQMEMMVRRDRNCPSVFIWSTGNEEADYYRRPQGVRIHRALEHIAHTLDPTRLVTTAVNEAGKTVIQDHLEVIGINYSLKHIDDIHAKHPDKPMFFSENCAVGSTRGWYYGDSPAQGYLDARDRMCGEQDVEFAGREKYWRLIMERPWNAGEFQWDAFEHRGEAVWPRVCSVSGAIDLFLQRKDAFYQNQSHWLERPMIHALPHWTHRGMEGMPIQVWVYTNCEEAELLLNGESLGRRPVQPWCHLEWSVTYTPGELKVIGYRGGKPVAEETSVTTGRPVALRLTLENGPVRANGQDIAVVTCTALDAQGREVPDASPMVHFDCIGGGRIVGTGSDITDHVPVPCPDRRMWAGRISVAVRVSGAFRLLARAEDLDGAWLDVEAEQA